MSARSEQIETNPEWPLTLAISSSTGAVSLGLGRVAPTEELLNEVRVLAVEELATERRHAEELTPGLQKLMAEAGHKLEDIQKLVVDVGPGRFTGLRVGLATAKGLAFALQLPVVGLSSLEILAGVEPEGSVTSVIDARREEVFQQVFVDGIATSQAEVGPASQLAASAMGVVVGDGADRYKEAYQGRTEITMVGGRNPNAVTMLSLSGQFKGASGSDIEPIYIRNPDVNPNIKTRPTVTKPETTTESRQ